MASTSALLHRPAAALLAGAALALAGCGAASSGPSTSQAAVSTTVGSSQTRSSTPPPRLAAALSGVRGRVLAAGEMGGFAPEDRTLSTDPRAWLNATQVPADQQVAELGRLRRWAFVKAVREDLLAHGGQPGLSIVEEFGTPAGARAELRAQVALAGSGPMARFAAAEIPGARAFGDSSGANVAFTKGRYYYLVGAAAAGGGATLTLAQTQVAVAGAALRLYRRVGD